VTLEGEMQQPDQANQDEIKAVLSRFQDGYTQRDVGDLDMFMQLFSDDIHLEVIGTGGIDPGDDEWCRSLEAVRELIKNDWESWGDLHLEIERARISTHGDVAWCAMPATVIMHFDREESYQDYLDYLQQLAKDEAIGSTRDRLLEILRGTTNSLYEFERGETFVWPLRFTAVLVKEGQWRFHQMQFSFATTRFPDVRINAG
jgi:hypothetical protein